MHKAFLIAIFLFAVPTAHSGEIYERVAPARSKQSFPTSIPFALAFEAKETVRDLATFKDPAWEALTIAQIAASLADAKTSLVVFRHHPTSGEVGISRFVVGVRPDVHKYVIAGVMEIAVEAIFAHYLRNHGPGSEELHGPREEFDENRGFGEKAQPNELAPARKWYWRAVWTLPQSISLYEHTHATFINLGHY